MATLQVLDAETRLFDSQLQLAALKRDEQVAVLQLYLYRAPGGGWPSGRRMNRLTNSDGARVDCEVSGSASISPLLPGPRALG